MLDSASTALMKIQSQHRRQFRVYVRRAPSRKFETLSISCERNIADGRRCQSHRKKGRGSNRSSHSIAALRSSRLRWEERFQLLQSFQWFQWLENPTGRARFGERTGRTLGSVGFVENVKISLLKPNQIATGFFYFKLLDGIERLENLRAEVTPSEEQTGNQLSYKFTLPTLNLR
jgi:hypothetical protein